MVQSPTGLNHFTDIRQYSMSTVTVKEHGQFAEVEAVGVFPGLGWVDFAAAYPLAYEVAADGEAVFLELFCGVGWRADYLVLP